MKAILCRCCADGGNAFPSLVIGSFAHEADSRPIDGYWEIPCAANEMRFLRGAGRNPMKNVAERLFSRGTLLAAAVVCLVFVGLLYLEGRPAWCKYGLGLWSAAWSNCTSQHFLDPYSLTHVLHGIIFFWILRLFASKVDLQWRLIGAIVLEVSWELLENSPWVIERYRQETASLDYTGDSIVNSLGDVIATILGFAFASRVSWKVALAVFVAVELGLAYFVRDNLTLNVIMLFFPLDSLKEWQLHG